MESGVLSINDIGGPLPLTRIGRRIEHFSCVTSTNDIAWSRIDDPDADGLVILAELQTAGRGRFGRAWESPRGASLLCSLVIIDEAKEIEGAELGLLVSVAACDAIASTTDVTPLIKWPNDILVAHRKLGGILVESRQRVDQSRAYVVGIGINCLQQTGHLAPSLAETATSLELESRQRIDRNALAAALLVELDRWLAHPGEWSYADLRNEWMVRALPVGGRIHLRRNGREYHGTMLDLDPVAALLVRLDEGPIQAFNAAETTIVRFEHGEDHAKNG